MNRPMIEKPEKVCPFIKIIEMATTRNGMKFYDRFGKCLGDRCMAYKDGRCLKLGETPEAPEYGEKAERKKPETRADNGTKICPKCGYTLYPRYAPVNLPRPDFCQKCGQAIDWAPLPELDEEVQEHGEKAERGAK